MPPLTPSRILAIGVTVSGAAIEGKALVARMRDAAPLGATGVPASGSGT